MNERPNYRSDTQPRPSPHRIQQLDVWPEPDAPEKRLMIAILADAINCFVKYSSVRNRCGQRAVHEAERWLLCGDKEWLFSFENICDVLGLNSSYLRSG